MDVDRAAVAWSGRDDGPGAQHARWHTVMRPLAADLAGLGDSGSSDDSGGSSGSEDSVGSGGVVVLGFASDEGVRRNKGRVGAADGPDALRAALGSLADPGRPLADAGDVVVADGDLEAGQARLGAAVAAVLDAGALPVVLGGGHAVAFGTYLGWAPSAGRERWGVLNIDTHFDLRDDPTPSSGTPFLQAARAEADAGRTLRYGIVGISRANNTAALFETADALGVTYLEDDACDPAAVRAFVADFLADVDRVHLTIDLDALPASVAPGVSAPAGFGIGLDAVRAAVSTVARTGALGILEVAELNPRYDIDARTARVGARLVDEAIRTLT